MDTRNKKVGIITWHYFQNYGSALQAYALYTFLSESKYDVRIIDYRSKRFCHSKLKEVLKAKFWFCISLFSRKRAVGFNRFVRKHLKLTKLYYDSIHLQKPLNAIIFGSDQIWAANVFDKNYFGCFCLPDCKCKLIAYAPSVVTPQHYSNEQIGLIRDALRSFSAISFREQPSDSFLNDVAYGDMEYQIVCDPTLLISKDHYKKLAQESKITLPTDYVIDYFLSPTKEISGIVDAFCEENHLQRISLSKLDVDKVYNYYNRASPSDFLNAILNAHVVFTDSFHATIFSILFEKTFYCYERFSKNDSLNQNRRIHDLLKLFGLESRLVNYGDNSVPKNEDITHFSNERSTRFINFSKDFLLKAINDDK